MTRDIAVLENEPIQGLASDDLAFLQRRLGGRLVSRRRGWAIVRVVGHVVTPSGRLIRIRSSKSSTSALLAWLGYADPTLVALRLDTLAAGVTDEGDLGPLLSRVFLRALRAAVERNGVSRSYARTETRSPAVRGAINFTRLVADGHNMARIPCATWTRAVDTPLNRILSAALHRVAVDPALSASDDRDLARLASIFREVPITRVSPRPTHEPLSRMEGVFRPAYELALLLLRRSGLGDGSKRPGLSFLVDLERLFEQAVQRAFRESPLQPCYERKMVVITKVKGAQRKAVPMYLDVLCHTEQGRLVVDAKFKHEPSAANIQQITTYCALTGASQATLVLPGTAAQDFEFEVATAAYGLPRKIRIVHFDTHGSSASAWQSAARDLVGRASCPPRAAVPR